MNRIYWILIPLATIFMPKDLQAYVGPGAGLTAIGSILAFIGTVLLMIIGFFWYPIKRLIKKISKKKTT